jgi:hypothetical protein
MHWTESDIGGSLRTRTEGFLQHGRDTGGKMYIKRHHQSPINHTSITQFFIQLRIVSPSPPSTPSTTPRASRNTIAMATMTITIEITIPSLPGWTASKTSAVHDYFKRKAIDSWDFDDFTQFRTRHGADDSHHLNLWNYSLTVLLQEPTLPRYVFAKCNSLIAITNLTFTVASLGLNLPLEMELSDDDYSNGEGVSTGSEVKS